MKCKLVFNDWRQIGKSDSIYNDELGFKLSEDQMRSGTTFDAEITFNDPSIEDGINDAMKDYKAYPVFYVLTKE